MNLLVTLLTGADDPDGALGVNALSFVRDVRTLGWNARLVGPRPLLDALPPHELATLTVAPGTGLGDVLLTAEPLMEGRDMCLLTDPALLPTVMPVTCLFRQLQADVLVTLRGPSPPVTGVPEPGDVLLVGDLVTHFPARRRERSTVRGLYVLSSAIFGALRASSDHSLHAAIHRLTRHDAVFAYQSVRPD